LYVEWRVCCWHAHSGADADSRSWQFGRRTRYDSHGSDRAHCPAHRNGGTDRDTADRHDGLRANAYSIANRDTERPGISTVNTCPITDAYSDPAANGHRHPADACLIAHTDTNPSASRLVLS
jgi:hypothetical protein